ncbi:LamG-like jellyroll fold domain-containing protein [Sphingobacterium sp. HJSM2_6]|uniref:LamG-like jellyroll fold domain-containing protein n=1 Tax=Sphingobacterium sp. HJSM2_6 TaxID=3366264 RepID=UPI003BCD362F
MKKMINKIVLSCMLFTVAVLSQSCNEEFSKILPETGEENVDVLYGKPKVLLIIADGARGESVRTANISNLNSIIPNSIYSWVSLSEENALAIQSNWTNILTGVNYTKHGVRDNDYSLNKLEDYPLVFKRILQENEDAKMSIVSPSSQFIDEYATGITGVSAQNDADVTTKTVDQLKAEDIDFVTAHFTDIETAGKEVGYDNSFPTYKASIEKFDGQVGEILAGLRSRSNFDKENWLVVITSSQGGFAEIPDNQNDNTIFSNPNLNTFTIMYTPKFTSKYVGKPFIGNKYIGDFMLFKGQNYAELNEGDNDVFNLGLNDFTIEFKIKKNKGSNNTYSFSYPSVVGKRLHWQSDWDRETDGIGWVIHLAGESWIFNARGDKGTGEVKADKNLNRGTWNSITVTGSTKDGVRTVRLYTNGELSKEGNITGWGAINSAAKLRVGYLPNKNGWASDAYVADVKIWKAALSPDVVKQFSCEIGVSPNHPYYGFLAGNWPLTGTDQNQLFDDGPLGNHLTTGSNNYPIARLNDYMCAPTSSSLAAMVPRNLDIATQIISWLKVPRQTSWQLDGRVWIDK